MTVIRSLIGVYDADGSIRGELAYVVGRALGRRHCALCEITHGRVRESEQWPACREGLPVPFEAVHLDERSAAVRAASDGRAPCVLAQTDGGLSVLVGAAELEACVGDPRRLVAALEAAAAAGELSWL
jgi:hypothetical protein